MVINASQIGNIIGKVITSGRLKLILTNPHNTTMLRIVAKFCKLLVFCVNWDHVVQRKF